MKQLVELIGIYSGDRRSRRTPFGRSNRSYAAKLYHLIASEVVDSDTTAIIALFGENTAATRRIYARTKYKLQQHLVNLILARETADREDPQIRNTPAQLLRQLYAIQVILSRGGIVSGVSLAKRLLRRAEEAELYHIAHQLVRILRRVYAIVLADRNLYDQYQAKFESYKILMDAIEEAESMYFDLALDISHQKNRTEEFRAKLDKYTAAVRKMKVPMRSSRLFYYRQVIPIIRAMTLYHYAEAERLLERAIDGLRELPNYQPSQLVSFYINLIKCQVYLRKFEKGQRRIEEALKLVKAGSFNWFQFKIAQMTLAFYAERYDYAVKVYSDVRGRRRYHKLAKPYRELWDMYLLWMRILDKVGKLDLPRKYKSRHYNISHYVHNLKLFKRDKEGFNANIRIAQFFWHLAYEDFHALYEMEEALQRYRRRYAKSKVPLERRTNIMFGYIIGLIKREFVYGHCLQITKTALRKLEETPMGADEEFNFDIEIIPYDIVINYTMELLAQYRLKPGHS